MKSLGLNIIPDKILTSPYQGVLFKDKTDINLDFKDRFPYAKFLGCMEKSSINPEIEILSVKFSKVGKTTLEKLPNLKFIVCRSHGVDNINHELCKMKGINVRTVNPTSLSVAKYIYHQILSFNIKPPYIIYGYGNIGKSLSQYLDDYLVINSKTPIIEIKDIFKTGNTLIVTVPLNPFTDKKFNHNLLSGLKSEFIVNVSRGKVFDSKTLINILNKGCKFIGDTLLFIKHKNAVFTNHTAWKYDLNLYDYIKLIGKEIDLCY